MPEPKDSPDDPERLPDDAEDADLPPFAYNEAYWYGEGEDDRLVSDISERYPDQPSGDVDDDQPVVDASMEARWRSVSKASGNADGNDVETVADDASIMGILRRVRLRAEAKRGAPFARSIFTGR